MLEHEPKEKTINLKKDRNRGWERVLLIFIPFILFTGIFSHFGLTIANIEVVQHAFPLSSTEDLFITFFNLLGTFLFLWCFMKFVDKEPFINLGFIKGKNE